MSRPEQPEAYLALLMRQAGISPTHIAGVFGWTPHYTSVVLNRAAKRNGVTRRSMPKARLIVEPPDADTVECAKLLRLWAVGLKEVERKEPTVSNAKTVEAMAAIDHTGRWVIYGFHGLDDIEAFHQTGCLEALEDPIAYCKVRVILYLPTEPKLPTVAGASMAIKK